jgi:D-sedoheptulose 7-phosphate isomerase
MDLVEYISERNEGLLRALDGMNYEDLFKIIEKTYGVYKHGGKLLICGNGGSWADGEHFVGEFVTDGFPAINLGGSVAAMTAIGNDIGYHRSFDRALETMGSSGDILYGISTSGKAENVKRAMELAKDMGIYRIGVTGIGRQTQEIVNRSDLVLQIPSEDTQIIQTCYMDAFHRIWECMRILRGVDK